MMRRWWLREWDYLLIVVMVLIVALLFGGMISATIDAVRRASLGY